MQWESVNVQTYTVQQVDREESGHPAGQPLICRTSDYCRLTYYKVSTGKIACHLESTVPQGGDTTQY